ncbi:hypothetical protein O9K51_04776 [Purpureocillium lavendulum]|uniref:Uncharacterized protein n=1 Tax=Purpureocillium lavendulum TaxID=1247861 RepID=A0AB34FYV2_9HYPO|nr:hypothetical protein O9K51_04776 [Purpureocillium lavendulum]
MPLVLTSRRHNGVQWASLHRVLLLSAETAKGPPQCDRIQSGCTQCKRKAITCPGYGDPSQIRIRDETDRVVVKAQAPPKSRKSRPVTPDHQRHAAAPAGSSPRCRLERLPIHSLPQVVCDAAVAFFMTSYIVATPFEGYLPEFFISQCFRNSPCTLAVSATAMATFARRVRCDTYLDTARRNYALALARTNEALADPAAAVLDSTLAAVLLLGLFEAVVFQGGQAPTNWTAHTFGAMQLLRLRGTGQFKSPVSQKLYAQASNNIKTSCIQKSVPLPVDFIAFNEEVRPLVDPDDPAIRLAPVVDRVASIKARASVKVDAKLVEEAWLLDHEIVTFGQHLPYQLQYTTDKIPAAVPGRGLDFSDTYPNLRVAKVWNAIRLLRQFLVSFMSNVPSGEIKIDVGSLVLPGAHESDPLLALSRYAAESMDELAAQVLASAPSFLDGVGPERRFSPPARSLVWPLTIVEKSDICSRSYRELAAACLEELARDLNMPQAVRPDRDPGGRGDW